MSILAIPTPRAFLPLLEPGRYKGAYGGRASAKSHFFAGLWAETQVSERADCVCVRETQKSLDQSVKKLLEEKLVALEIRDQFEVKRDHIISPNGGVTIFQGMQDHTAQSIKSLENYKYAWVEEAQTLKQRSLDMLRPTIRAANSELWFSWNPRFETDPVDQLLRGDTPPPGAIVVNVSYRDNPWLTQEMMLELEYDQRRDPEKFAHVWLGGYEQHSEARVFKNWTIEEFERPVGTIFRLGADWGYSIDPAVLLRCSIEGNRLYIDHEAYMIGCEIVHLPDLFARVPESDKWFITADSSRPETISHMRRHGYPKINSAVKGPRSIEEGIAFLQSYDIIVHPRCKHLIDELTLYRYKTDPMTGQILPMLEDKHNHCIDALRYACEGVRKARPIKRTVIERVPASSTAWMAS